jgi:hypothetical protein
MRCGLVGRYQTFLRNIMPPAYPEDGGGMWYLPTSPHGVTTETTNIDPEQGIN